MATTTTTDNQWVLFGIDLKGLWHDYLAAWREVFLQHGSSVRKFLDEPVLLLASENRNQEQLYKSAKNVAVAVQLPDSLVLAKQLQIPASARARIHNIVQSEVMAGSPFPAEDTVYGWKVKESAASTLTLVLVLGSKSIVMEYIHQNELPEANELEVWGVVGDEQIVIDGFGEHARNQRYGHKLRRLAVMSLLLLLCAVTVCVTPVVYKIKQLHAVQTEYDTVRLDAGEVARLRASLARKSELIEKLNGQITSTTHPLFALNTMTYLLENDVWLSAYQQQGRLVEIQGTSENAAAMMKMLAEQEIFESVRATSAFRKLGRTDKERFQIELTFQGRGK